MGIAYYQRGGSDVLAEQRLAKHLLFEHAPPEENRGIGYRVARFSKVAKDASNVEIGILSLSTNEQSRETQRRSSACRDSESSALLRFRVLDFWLRVVFSIVRGQKI